MQLDADKLEKEAEEEQLIDGGRVMSIIGHLYELRHRVIKSVLGIVLCFLIALFFSTPLLTFLKGPLVKVFPPGSNPLHFTGPLDVFLAEIKMSFLASLVASCPIWLYQFWRFFEPALYQRERKYVLPCVVISVALFLFGITFCFYFVLPMTLDFLIQLGSKVGTPMITIVDYLALLSVMIFGFGFVFEAPLVLVLMGMLNLVQADTLARHRRGVVVGVLILAALLTPPDPVTQVAMAIPLYIMYEISIFLIRWLQKKNSSSLVGQK